MLAVVVLYFGIPHLYSLFTEDPRALRQSGVTLFRISLSTGYVSIVLFFVSLANGTWQLVRKKRRLPVHLDLRRDLGIWAGAIGLLHVAFGLFIHVRWNPLHNFIYPPHVPHSFPLRGGPFGFANHAGLIATLILLLLLAISNDASITKLGQSRWKSLQRWSYVCFGLLIVHSVLYELVEHRPVFLIVLFAIAVGITLIIQLWGVHLHRKFSPAKTPNSIRGSIPGSALEE